MKLAVLVIASSGKLYDDFKRIWLTNWQMFGPKDSHLYFLYGRGYTTDVPSDYDMALDVEENIIPGVLMKTMLALRGLRAPYDYVLRTNLSSLYNWSDYMNFLKSGAPTSSCLAGCSPDRSHVGGCGFTMSYDVVEKLLDGAQQLDVSLVDDVAISNLLFPSVPVTWTARVDFVYDNKIEVHNGFQQPFHFRFKNFDRTYDAQRMWHIFEESAVKKNISLL